MHFRILKMIATSGFLSALECTKFNFAPDPAGGAYSAPADPLAGLKGLLLREGEGKGRRKRGGREGKT